MANHHPTRAPVGAALPTTEPPGRRPLPRPPVAPTPPASGRPATLALVGWGVLIAVIVGVGLHTTFDPERPPHDVVFEATLSELDALHVTTPLRRGVYTTSLTCLVARRVSPCPPMPLESVDARASGTSVSGTTHGTGRRLWGQDDACTQQGDNTGWNGTEMMRGLTVERDTDVSFVVQAVVSPRIDQVRQQRAVCETFGFRVIRESILPVQSVAGLWLWYTRRD